MRANVPAEVFVGSRSLGYAPVLDAPLAPGVHTVRVVSPARPVAREFTVTIRPRRTVTLAAEWPDGPAPPS